jgi:hypothetical protein
MKYNTSFGGLAHALPTPSVNATQRVSQQGICGLFTSCRHGS